MFENALVSYETKRYLSTHTWYDVFLSVGHFYFSTKSIKTKIMADMRREYHGFLSCKNSSHFAATLYENAINLDVIEEIIEYKISI